MTPSEFFAFMLFAVVTSVTPGPNNIMIAASAANHGVRAIVPHMLGINLGFGLMVALVGFGLAGPLAASPVLHSALRWIGTGWILWIAWRMVRADPAMPSHTAATSLAPMGFGAAALFQWVNPKAWVIAVVTSTTYTVPNHSLVGQVLSFAALFALVGVPCNLIWSLVGAGAGRVLRSPAQWRAFNAVMAALLVLSVIPLLIL